MAYHNGLSPQAGLACALDSNGITIYYWKINDGPGPADPSNQLYSMQFWDLISGQNRWFLYVAYTVCSCSVWSTMVFACIYKAYMGDIIQVLVVMPIFAIMNLEHFF